MFFRDLLWHSINITSKPVIISPYPTLYFMELNFHEAQMKMLLMNSSEDFLFYKTDKS